MEVHVRNIPRNKEGRQLLTKPSSSSYFLPLSITCTVVPLRSRRFPEPKFDRQFIKDFFATKIQAAARGFLGRRYAAYLRQVQRCRGLCLLSFLLPHSVPFTFVALVLYCIPTPLLLPYQVNRVNAILSDAARAKGLMKAAEAVKSTAAKGVANAREEAINDLQATLAETQRRWEMRKLKKHTQRTEAKKALGNAFFGGKFLRFTRNKGAISEFSPLLLP